MTTAKGAAQALAGAMSMVTARLIIFNMTLA
jgi:hypothetical protein